MLGGKVAEVRKVASLSKRRSMREVLRYSLTGPKQGTVWRHYVRWRAAQNPPLPVRCDNPVCFFHTNPLIWNDKPLKPILDHKDGNNRDNRPEMLRLLCPNCDSQLVETRGGANKGRIKQAEGGFAKVSRDGKRAYVLPAETGIYSVIGQDLQQAQEVGARLLTARRRPQARSRGRRPRGTQA
jgi:hypothetical protein